MARYTENNKGFTFLELLLVFSLISILALMMVPSVHKMKEKGRQATCIGNQRQLAVAALLYANESVNKLPVNIASLIKGDYVPYEMRNDYYDLQGSSAYAQGEMPDFYNHDFRLTKCPEVSGSILDQNPTISYGFNVYITGIKIDLIESAATTVMFTDSHFSAVSNTQEVDFRHGAQSAIAAYVDGHIELFKDIIPPSKFTPAEDSDKPNSPNKDNGNNGLGNGGEESQGEYTDKGEDPSNPAHGNDCDLCNGINNGKRKNK